MSAISTDRSARFYFALPRLAAQLRGTPDAGSSQSSAEANLVSLAIYALTFTGAVRSFWTARSPWIGALELVFLAFGSFLFWLLMFTLHWLLIELVRACGWWREVPNDRLQGAFILLETSVIAAALCQAGGWSVLPGAAWLTVLALNLAASAVLRLIDGTTRFVR